MARKWLIGCGIGCVALIVVGVAVTLSFVIWLRGTFEGVTEAIASHEEIVSTFGEIEEFAPAPGGAIPPDRLERFLAVRESLVEAQAGLDTLFADFPPDEFLDEKDSVLKKILAAIGMVASLINPIGEYVDQRNQALLEQEMGLGEYVYIYSIAYHSWLGRSPDDGPVITKETGPGRGNERGRRIMDDEEATYGPQQVRRRYRRYLLAILRNQLDSLPAASASEETDEWRQELVSEINRFESHPMRVLWQDGLPDTIEASLAPYRRALEERYHASTNCFELPPAEGEDWGRWSN